MDSPGSVIPEVLSGNRIENFDVLEAMKTRIARTYYMRHGMAIDVDEFASSMKRRQRRQLGPLALFTEQLGFTRFRR